MAVVANQAVAFDKSMLTACRFKPANVPIEERTTGGPHLGDVLRPGLILDHAQTGSRPTPVRGRNVQFDHLGISGGRIRANNRGVVFHP